MDIVPDKPSNAQGRARTHSLGDAGLARLKGEKEKSYRLRQGPFHTAPVTPNPSLRDYQDSLQRTLSLANVESLKALLQQTEVQRKVGGQLKRAFWRPKDEPVFSSPDMERILLYALRGAIRSFDRIFPCHAALY